MPVQQDIRFAATGDGVKLAMAIYGKGPPLVKAATWLTHIERDPSSNHNRPWIEELSRNHTYVTYDARGCGLSSRNVADISFDAWVRDLETVVDALGLDRFPLVGISQGAAIAIAYAAMHPERVSHLILLGSFATSYFTTGNPDPRIVDEAETLLNVMKLGWGQGSSAMRQVFVSKFMPGATQQQQRDFDEHQRVSATPGEAVRSMRAMFKINVKDEARKVKCPSLVFHIRGDQLIYFDQGRNVAALIPGAKFVPLDGENHLPFEGEPCWTQIVHEIRAFLGEPASRNPSSPKLTARQTEVLRLVAGGSTDKQIARALELSHRTVEMHVAAAIKALGCGTRTEAVHRAGEAGLL